MLIGFAPLTRAIRLNDFALPTLQHIGYGV
jgi:hypothetical protein